MKKFTGIIRASDGEVLDSASVTIVDVDTGSNATLYATDNTGGATLSNPLTTTALGRYTCFVPDGEYNLTVSKTGYTSQSVNNITIYDPFSDDAGDNATPITKFVYDQAGTGAVLRTLVSRLQDTVSVKDFGAVGDGVTDDTAAIQATIDVVFVAGGTVFFPTADVYYKVTSGLSLDDATGLKGVILKGDGNKSYIRGTIDNGAIITRTVFPGAGSEQLFGIAGLRIQNDGTTAAWGVRLHGIVGASYIRECRVDSRWGIDASIGIFSMNIEAVRLLGTAYPSTSMGILLGNHVSISSCDIVSYEHGIRAFGSGASITGCRLEVNKVGMMLGQNTAGATSILSRALISGNSFEANDIGIQVNAFNSSTITGVGMLGSTNSPSSQSKIGLYILSATGSNFSNMVLSGSYDNGAITSEAVDGNFLKSSFKNISTVNSFANGVRWNWRGRIADTSFENTDFEPNHQGQEHHFLVDTISSRGFQAFDYLTDSLPARNVRGKDIVVTASASSVAILFPTAKSVGQAAIKTITATTGGSLADDTYFYVATLVTPMGEVTSAEQSVVVSGANNQVDLAFFGVSGSHWRRRVYRGTATGIYDGFYEMALESSADFNDTGAAFDGKKSAPVASVACPTGEEADANFAIVATPDWDTSVWVSSKATTGFTLNFGTTSGSDQTVDWFLVR